MTDDINRQAFINGYTYASTNDKAWYGGQLQDHWVDTGILYAKLDLVEGRSPDAMAAWQRYLTENYK